MSKKLKFLVVMLASIITTSQLMAADKTWTWTATSASDLGTSTVTNQSLSGIEGGSSVSKKWDVTRVASPYTNSSLQSSCIQIGKSGGAETLTLSSSDFSGTIKSVAIECSSYKGNHSVAISVGGTSYLASTATATWTAVNSKSGTGSKSGTITISFTKNSSARAMYVKSITVVYNTDGVSGKTLL